MAPKAEDEGGHMRVPAHCHVPAESERLRREVDARKRLDRGDRFPSRLLNFAATKSS